MNVRGQLASQPDGDPIMEKEVDKPESFRDDDSINSSISEERRVGRPSRSGWGDTGPQRLKVTRSVSDVRDGIESRRELELGSLSALEKQPTPRNLADEDLVTWDLDDPDNPKTWALPRKWAAVVTVSLFTLISPVSSTMTAPALNYIGAELNITSEFEKELSLSIFVLGEFYDSRGGFRLWGLTLTVLQHTQLVGEHRS